MPNEKDRVINWFEVINSLARFYADTAATVENNPPELCVVVGEKTIPLTMVVHEELIRVVFRWPQWQLLFQNSANSYIQPPSAAMRTARRVTTPTRSDDLWRPFDQCVRELDGFTRTKAAEAIDRLLRGLAEQVTTQRESLTGFCQNAGIRERLKHKLGSESADLVDVLYEAADPIHLGDKLRKSCLSTEIEAEIISDEEADTGGIPPLKPAAVFPLPIGLKFGWHEEVWKELSPDQRCDHTHQSWVPRIRDTLLASADEALFGLAAEINSRAVRNLREECNELSFLLQNEIVAGNQEFIRSLETVLTEAVEPLAA